MRLRTWDLGWDFSKLLAMIRIYKNEFSNFFSDFLQIRNLIVFYKIFRTNRSDMETHFEIWPKWYSNLFETSFWKYGLLSKAELSISYSFGMTANKKMLQEIPFFLFLGMFAVDFAVPKSVCFLLIITVIHIKGLWIQVIYFFAGFWYFWQ